MEAIDILKTGSIVGGVAVNRSTYSHPTNLYLAQRFCFCGKAKLLQ